MGKRHAGQNGDDDHGGLRRVDGQEELNCLLQVVVDRASFLDRAFDGGKVVVRQYHGRCLAGGVGPFLAHGDADVGALQRRRVVDTPSPVIAVISPSA
jgi:hypothetical protein